MMENSETALTPNSFLRPLSLCLQKLFSGFSLRTLGAQQNVISRGMFNTCMWNYEDETAEEVGFKGL